MRRAAARRTDPSTSHVAAASVAPSTITDAQARVLVLLARYGPSTDEQLVARYGRAIRLLSWPLISESGLRTRRAELVRDGHVVAADRNGRTSTGRSATTWRLASDPEPIP